MSFGGSSFGGVAFAGGGTWQVRVAAYLVAASARMFRVSAVVGVGQVDTLHTNPALVPQGVAETIPWQVDLSPVLASWPGATPTAVSTVFLDPYGTPVTLLDSPTISGNVVTQTVRASEISSGKTFTLRVVFTPSSTSAVLMVELSIQVTT